MPISKIDITPGVSVLAVLQHLPYQPWYALSEFVDNSVESYVKHRQDLEKTYGNDLVLRVGIDIDSSAPARISIRDNAAGIFEAEYERAFRAAAIPPDRTGLAEFGMGMKSAACWFAPQWSVRTTALGEPVERTVRFDIANIVNDNIQELEILEQEVDREAHYTEVILENISHVPVGRTVGKLKEHITDIYRAFIRDGLLELRFNGEELTYEPPTILAAPYYRDQNGPRKEWHKHIEFDFGDGLSVNGFAALREKAATAKAGFALFRRGRVIQGSADEGYRPSYIFGSSNSYRYQRLFGELHLEGFEVSHTKDGFRWDENEQPFLELLREHLDSDELPLLRQAEGYRVRISRALISKAANTAVSNASNALEEHLPDALPSVADAEPVETPTDENESTSSLARRSFEFNFRDRAWVIELELTDDPAESRWLVINTPEHDSENTLHLEIRVSMAHPFMVRFAQNDTEDMEALLRVASAIALAEVLAKQAGVRMAGTITRNMNDILRDALSSP